MNFFRINFPCWSSELWGLFLGAFVDFSVDFFVVDCFKGLIYLNKTQTLGIRKKMGKKWKKKKKKGGMWIANPIEFLKNQTWRDFLSPRGWMWKFFILGLSECLRKGNSFWSELEFLLSSLIPADFKL